MSWYKKAQNIFTGYKVVAFNGEHAYSLYQKDQIVDINIGNEIYDPNGIYLGTSKKFCLDYYTGLTDDQDILLTYSFGEKDLIKGEPNSPNSEILVSRAKLIGAEKV